MMRLLVADGNIAKIRDRMAETAGATAAQSYAEVLRKIAPDAQIDICTPADDGAAPPADLASYDGVAITGSSLNIYEREPAALRQIDFLREIFELGIPVFGSCWGLQLAAVAAGGEVAPNPRGREVAFARKITLTGKGRQHPMHANRSLSFDAPAIHLDEVARLPAQTIVTAHNDVAQVQAAEIRFGNGVFWGVQYHPEYGLHDVAFIIRRYGKRLVDEGFFHDLAELECYASDLEALQHDRTRRDIAWRLGLGAEIIDDSKRTCEIANWIAHLVRPRANEGE
jgi:GMP synthase (glutamine-hydrolysing)